MASPENLLAQRNKIQQQILELESTLGVDSSIVDLLSSSSGSDEESDDSGHAEQERVPDNLEVKRQQIQREIDELERTLGGDAALVDNLTDSEHGSGSNVNSSNEDSDGDELELPENAETCLQVNLVYQEVLKEKLAELERLLSENQQQQKEIEAQLSGPVPSSAGLPHLKLFLGTFMKPYFKDKLMGLGPPANEETREKMSQGTRGCDEMKIRRWEAWQKTLLTKSVAADTMKRMLQPKLSKMEYLTTKMSNAKDEDKEELKKQIAILEKNIAEISSMKDEELYGNRHDDHDWDKIANTDFEGLRQPNDLMRFWQNYLHPSINKSTWKQDEIEKLSEIAEEYDFCHWDQITEALGTNRTAFMCFQTYQRYIAKSFRKRDWTKEEDQAFRDLVDRMRIGNFIPYTQISYFMEGRDHAQLMYRWTCVLDPSIKKGPWSKEEDELLLKAVEKYGRKDWWKIRVEVPGRTDNACRERYLNCLQENVRKGTWSVEEVELLKRMVAKYGVGKWSKIASEIPNRLDSQCLNKWKWMMQTSCVQRKRKRPARAQQQQRRKKVTRKKVQVKDDSDSTSEDENIKVEYMDSDEEKQKDNEADMPSDTETDPREEYIQPDMKEWIPVCGKAQLHSSKTLKTGLVRLPDEKEVNNSHESWRPIRSTVLNNMGKPVKTYVNIVVSAVNKWDLYNERSMIRVPMNDIKLFLSKLRGRAKTITTSLSKAQENAPRNGQKITTKKRRQILSRRHDRYYYDLMMAVVPWLGNMLIPLPQSERKVCKADVVQSRGADIPLPKTPVFLLFLKVLQIDAEGCKKVIEAMNTKGTPSTGLRPYEVIPYANSSNVKTVRMLLAEREMKKAEAEKSSKTPQSSEVALLSSPPQNKDPQTSSSLMAPQTFVVAQPNTHQRVGIPQPVGQKIVLLQSGTQGASQTSQTLPQTVLRLVPLEPVKSALPAAPPAFSASSTLPEHSDETRASKRKRQPTEKAQALMENIRAKSSKRSLDKNKMQDVAPAVSVMPQATAWIVTPAGLMPVTGIQLPSPVPGGDINQVNSSVPKATQRIVTQNAGVVSAVEPSNLTNVLPTGVKTSGTATLMTPTSVSSVPPNTTMLTSVPGSAIKMQSPKFLNVVPQTPFQPPIIVNHIGSLGILSNVVRPKTSSDSSQASIGNKLDITSSTPSSGSTATKDSSAPPVVSTLVGVSSPSAIPTSPVTTPAQPIAYNFFSPLVQMPSPAIRNPSKQNQKMMNPQIVPQVMFRQPLIMNQNGTLTVINTAGPCLPTNRFPAPITNVPKVPPSPLSSVSSMSSPKNATNSVTVSPAPTVVTSPATPGVNFIYGLPAPIQSSSPVNIQTPATVRFCANNVINPGYQILPQTVVRLVPPQATNPPLQTTTTTESPNPISNPNPSSKGLSLDSDLMFVEDPALVRKWMKGDDGISLPDLEHKMPYLPPFVSNIKTLVSLLKAKESLLKEALHLLPEEERVGSEEEAKVSAVRKVVSEKLKSNPAYSLLKARFLSCFTLPAFLATVHPCKEPEFSDLQQLEDDEDEKDKVQPAESVLNTNESEASATEFSGMSAKK
ncbi:snRNA-activating protein complex subunit 4 [Astyanax mexicanus]|uniref:snRNA-activating protein complex subunit 4 n=1 Tax=Astyanax mexicanus TaxID=7994 RepID=UPI0020CAFC15|nr:snRNA-activating protein complex subunit 4 [Astyanax mexicanus]XP_007243990.3 snRNA-activating protein complex subunit 4 [Astyanax mexicanus]XP_007243991.3 snRNA-activating protein complex subunit 4 [Astyanax mexicanus]